MANFQTHLTASTILGIGYGGAAYGVYHLPGSSCLLAAGLCSVSGMLPDIDSGPGRPLREITTFMAAVVPTMLLGHFLGNGLSQESIILAGALIYVAIRFGLAEFLKHYTVHRGMFHSFPTAAIFGELTFLLLYGETTLIRWVVAAAVVAGFLSHLVLDEIYSVQWDGRPRLKKSFGTAMKFFGEGWWPNVSAYAKLVVISFLVVAEPSLVQQIYHGQANQVAKSLEKDLHQLPGVTLSGLGTPVVPAAQNSDAQSGQATAAPADSQPPVTPHRAAWGTKDRIQR